MSEKKTTKQRKTKYLILLATVLSVGVYAGITSLQTYPASVQARSVLELETVQEHSEYIYVRSEMQTNSVVVLYPDRDVAAEAYTSLAALMASDLEMDVYIVKYPFKQLWLRTDVLKQLQKKQPQITQWYGAAHGSGGKALDALEQEDVKALFYLSAFPSKKRSDDVPVLAMRGSLDGVHNQSVWNQKKKMFPSDVIYYEIQEGNFSQFADFGLHKDDYVSLIDLKTQQVICMTYISDFLLGQ